MESLQNGVLLILIDWIGVILWAIFLSFKIIFKFLNDLSNDIINQSITFSHFTLSTYAVFLSYCFLMWFERIQWRFYSKCTYFLVEKKPFSRIYKLVKIAHFAAWFVIVKSVYYKCRFLCQKNKNKRVQIKFLFNV